MTKLRYLAVAWLSLMAAVAIAAYLAQGPSDAGARVGGPAPELGVTTLSGGTLSLGRLITESL